MNELKDMNVALQVAIDRNADTTERYWRLADTLAKADVGGDDECKTAALLRRMERTLRGQAEAVHECRRQLVRSMGRARGRTAGNRRDDGT
ncbi:MAG TPA: hypothetical protein VM008_17315 [Phycisphaerae bacterium]|nr:hypothetical protein [Phycisphaerae bacterium]